MLFNYIDYLVKVVISDFVFVNLNFLGLFKEVFRRVGMVVKVKRYNSDDLKVR